MRNITFLVVSFFIVTLLTMSFLYYFLNFNQQKPLSTKNTPVKNTSKVTGQPNMSSTPRHIVIVIEENHGYHDIIGNQHAPFINKLIKEGTLFTNAHGITHPSQPNYIALFSGSTHGVTNDHCPQTLSGDNLASSLVKQHLSFIGYSEDLPSVGYTGCHDHAYYRKHNPWVNFTNATSAINQPIQNFPKDFTKLPTIAFVIPNQNHDMHDGSINEADKWLKNQMALYIEWAKHHHSLFILTWDEDDFTRTNHIPLIIIGDKVIVTSDNTRVDHYKLLRTVEDMYHLPLLGQTKKTEPIVGIW